MRRAKIVATLGPATSSYENIRAIIDAGVDVARMNLSHGSYEVHEGVYRNVRKAADDSGSRSPCSSTCRARRSGSAGSRTARTSSPRATSSRSPPKTSSARRSICRHDVQGPARRT